MMSDPLVSESVFIPDTTVHPLNGSYVVHIGAMRTWLASHAPWLSPDDAEAFASSLMASAAAARRYRESCSEDESVSPAPARDADLRERIAKAIYERWMTIDPGPGSLAPSWERSQTSWYGTRSFKLADAVLAAISDEVTR